MTLSASAGQAPGSSRPVFEFPPSLADPLTSCLMKIANSFCILFDSRSNDVLAVFILLPIQTTKKPARPAIKIAWPAGLRSVHFPSDERFGSSGWLHISGSLINDRGFNYERTSIRWDLPV
jgi:hypothetical protein